MPRADRHNEIEVNLLTSGTLTYIVGGRRVTIAAGSMALFWAAVPHQIIEFSGVAPYLVATVPLGWFLQWKLPEPFVSAVLGGRMMQGVMTEHVEVDAALFRQWVHDLEDPSPEMLKTVQLEMEARFRRIAFSVLSSDGMDAVALKGHGRSELTKIEQMALYIAKNYGGELSLDKVAESVDLHPNYAATLFKKAFGRTINTYITEFRISHAQRLLITSDCKILEIALRSGFNSLSRFNATFKASCGCTPREYRTYHRGHG